MKVSTRGRYALRMMIDIAQNCDGKIVPIKDIASRQGVSVKYLEQIIRYYTHAKLLKSERGPQGGYTLTKKPSEYSVGEILRAIEGDLAPVACLIDGENICDRWQSCSTLPFWSGLDDAITSYVDSVSLQDFLTQ